MKRDLRCFLVLSALADQGFEKGDHELENHANAAASFFHGKLVGQAPHIDLVRALKTDAEALGENPIADLVPACLNVRMRALELLVQGHKIPTRK